ncbi:MAG: DUF6516 family protein [Azoarcus sp.]|jgi:hypothetical protein|nr:DUF6516 family protein [Azoarcus sp.]
MYNTKAQLISRRRVYITDTLLVSISVWRVPQPVRGSAHAFKYSLAYVVDGACVLRYDNEAGKGDHRHYGGTEEPYAFTTLEALFADFQTDITRWNHENHHL